MKSEQMNTTLGSLGEGHEITSCRASRGVADCMACSHYADILQCVRQIYSDTRWAVTPDGMLQEIG